MDQCHKWISLFVGGLKRLMSFWQNVASLRCSAAKWGQLAEGEGPFLTALYLWPLLVGSKWMDLMHTQWVWINKGFPQQFPVFVRVLCSRRPASCGWDPTVGSITEALRGAAGGTLAGWSSESCTCTKHRLPLQHAQYRLQMKRRTLPIQSANHTKPPRHENGVQECTYTRNTHLKSRIRL